MSKDSLAYPFYIYRLIAFCELNEEDQEYVLSDYTNISRPNPRDILFVSDDPVENSFKENNDYPDLQFLGAKEVYIKYYGTYGYSMGIEKFPAYSINGLDGLYITLPTTYGR